MAPPPLHYRIDGRPRVHSWLGIVSIVLPALVIAMVVAQSVASRALWALGVRNLEAVMMIGFAAGTLCALAAVIEAGIRRRRFLLPLISLAIHMVGIVVVVLLIELIAAARHDR